MEDLEYREGGSLKAFSNSMERIGTCIPATLDCIFIILYKQAKSGLVLAFYQIVKYLGAAYMVYTFKFFLNSETGIVVESYY